MISFSLGLISLNPRPAKAAKKEGDRKDCGGGAREMQRRCGGDVGEMWGRCRGDAAEVCARCACRKKSRYRLTWGGIGRYREV